MNEVFLIGKVISNVDFKFMIESRHFSISIFTIKTLDGQEIEIKCYDKLADFAYIKLKIEKYTFIYGKLKSNFIIAERLKLLK